VDKLAEQVWVFPTSAAHGFFFPQICISPEELQNCPCLNDDSGKICFSSHNVVLFLIHFHFGCYQLWTWVMTLLLSLRK
jgi:hypothetical protein